jgi:hypothetical protein
LGEHPALQSTASHGAAESIGGRAPVGKATALYVTVGIVMALGAIPTIVAAAYNQYLFNRTPLAAIDHPARRRRDGVRLGRVLNPAARGLLIPAHLVM